MGGIPSSMSAREDSLKIIKHTYCRTISDKTVEI
jgi:hypothetical protein